MAIDDNDTRAAKREHVDPEERIRPMPLLPALVAVGMVVWGVIYLATSGPFTPATLGDHRTLADLRGQPAAVAGAAVDGKAVYAANCAACHQAAGTGLPGVFPPLAKSEWVQSAPAVVANIVLHGIDGELQVEGTTYNGQMPSFAHLSDAELAAVLSYVRSDWGNSAPPVEEAVVKSERDANRRAAPFAGGADLEKLKGELG